VPFSYDEDVVHLIASRCTEQESGGRMIDAILTNTLLPDISAALLGRLLAGEAVSRVQVGAASGAFVYAFD
jgi:type VI secretion system protein VasG